VRLFGVRTLVVGGAMIVACQNARDARASRAADSASVAREMAVRAGGAGRDSVPGFTVPAQCARGSVPAPKKPVPAPMAMAPKTRADSVKRARSDSMHTTGAGGDTVHVVGAWRDSAGGAGGSHAEGGSAATRPDTTADTMRTSRADSSAIAATTKATAPRSPKAARADSIARVRAKMHADSLAAIALQTDSAATRRLPGSLLPGCRVVAYYGNPLSKRMGILGEIKPDSMLARLATQAAAYAAVDSGRPVLPALELIATVAQAAPGKSGLYRARMPDTLIARVMGWAEAHHYLVILDIQTGRSTMAAELVPLVKYLARPYVHLALDPEFSIGTKKVPGKVIGRIDAADVNAVSSVLATLVDSLKLPPKMLIVHRFTTPMLSNHQKIKLDPRVQVVIDMDGFGAPRLKYGSYKAYVHDRPVQFAGFKLFYKNDKPMLTPQQVVEMDPVPLFIMYQ
jgi:hypothetical protein